MMTKRIMVLFAITLMAAIAAQGEVYDETTGYVVLTKAVTPTPAAQQVAFDNAEFWSDGQEPHATTNYFVPQGKYFCTPGNFGTSSEESLTWGGGKLVVQGYVWAISTKQTTFNDLVLLGREADDEKNFYVAGAPGTVYGNLTICGTADAPTLFSVYGTQLSLAMTVTGNSSAAALFEAQQSSASITLGGDWNAYQGSLTLARVSPAKRSDTNSTNGYFITTSSLGGSLTICEDAWLTVPQATSVAGALTLEGGSELRFSTGNVDAASTVGCLNVAGLLSCTGTGKPRIVVASADTALTAAYEKTLLTFSSDSTVSDDDFELDLRSATEYWQHFLKLKVETVTDANGSHKELRLVKTAPAFITFNKSTAVENLYSPFVTNRNSNGDYFWSDEKTPESGKWYSVGSKNLYSMSKGNSTDKPCDVSGATFYFEKSNLMSASSVGASSALVAKDIYWTQGILRAWGVGVTDAAIQKNTYWFSLVCEHLYTFTNGVITSDSFNSQGVKYDCEVVGGGIFSLKPEEAQKASGRNAYTLFTHENTNFTGRIFVTAKTEPKQCPGDNLIAPSDDYCSTLFVTNGLSLGGRCASFVYDGLTLKRYGKLRVVNYDVTLADGLNRGVFVEGIGRVQIDQRARTLTINQPITLNGTFRKHGAGTLTLGGTLRFGSTGDASAAPAAGTNLVCIEEGPLCLANALALDGAAVTFTNNASLVLKETSLNDTLATKGLVNVKSVKGTFTDARVGLAPNQASLNVTLDIAAVEADPVEATFGLVTLPDEASARALMAKLSLPHKLTTRAGRPLVRAAVTVEENSDASWTIKASYRNQGLFLMFR